MEKFPYYLNSNITFQSLIVREVILAGGLLSTRELMAIFKKRNNYIHRTATRLISMGYIKKKTIMGGKGTGYPKQNVYFINKDNLRYLKGYLRRKFGENDVTLDRLNQL